MKSAAAQMATHQKLVKIVCSVERLKKMIAKAEHYEPDELVGGKPAWQHVEDNSVARYVNFANMFLYAGNATIKVVDKEPDPKVKLVMPE